MNPDIHAREIVANWMILRGYATGHGDTVQDLLFELEAQAKGRGGPPEPPPGQGDFEILQREVEHLRGLFEKWHTKAGELHAENERLRDRCTPAA